MGRLHKGDDVNKFKKYLIPILISLVVSGVAIFAYDVVIVQPQMASQSGSAPIEVETQSVTRYNRPAVFQDTVTLEEPVTMEGTLAVTGASTLTGNVTAAGTLGVTGLSTLSGGATVVGTVTLDADEIGIAEIENITRTVSIPLVSFIECTTDAGAAIDFSDDADAFPDFTGIATDGLGFYLEFDSTSATEDTAYICGNLVVPEDYASNGLFELVIGKDAETGANTEVVNCAGSIDGAALGAAGTVTTSGTALAIYSCEPTLTSLAAGNSLGFEVHITSAGTADDDVRVYSVGFLYTATQ